MLVVDSYHIVQKTMLTQKQLDWIDTAYFLEQHNDQYQSLTERNKNK
jgi:hypothetical protein